MTPGSPSQIALAEFRVIADHIGTRDLVQEFLAFRVFPTLKEWEMPKLKGKRRRGNLFGCLTIINSRNISKWLDTIEVMCNEILDNYFKKEDQLMTAAFGTRPKRRLNRVMDALDFEYPDYERLDKDAEGQKRKRVAGALNKDDEEQPKKKKLEPEPKTGVPKKRKATAPKQKAIDEEETAATPSATEVEEILKVLTESLPVKLSPLGPHLTKLFQKEKEPAKTKKAGRPKKQRIITVTEVIEGTPPGASALKAPAVESTTTAKAAPSEATTAEAARAEDIHLESTIADIDKILLNMAAEEAVAATEETMAPEPEKEKEIAKDTSEDEIFNFQNLVGQELTKAEKEELKEYAISCGYRPGALLFGGVDDEKLGCVRDHTGAKVIGTLSKSIGFSKLETDISRYRRQHIVGSLFYSNFKVNFSLTFIISITKMFSNEGCLYAEHATE
jgi:hypothetical protein